MLSFLLAKSWVINESLAAHSRDEDVCSALDTPASLKAHLSAPAAFANAIRAALSYPGQNRRCTFLPEPGDVPLVRLSATAYVWLGVPL